MLNSAERFGEEFSDRIVDVAQLARGPAHDSRLIGKSVKIERTAEAVIRDLIAGTS